MRHIITVIGILAVSSLFPFRVYAADVDIIKQRIRDDLKFPSTTANSRVNVQALRKTKQMLTIHDNVDWSDIHDEDPERSLVSSGDADGQAYMDSIQDDGSWADIHDVTAPNMNKHIQRMLLIARYWKDFDTPEYKIKVENALRYFNTAMKDHDVEGHWLAGQWALHDWGIPIRGLGPTLLLLQEHPSQDVAQESDVYKEALSNLAHMVGTSNPPLTSNETTTGANGIWRGLAYLYYGLLSGKTEYLDTAKKIIDLNSTIKSAYNDPGIKPDLSYQQHGPLLMTAAYGKAPVIEGFLYYEYTKDTAYAPNSLYFQNAYVYLLNGFRWIWFKGYEDPSAQSRGFSFMPVIATNNVEALLRMLPYSSSEDEKDKNERRLKSYLPYVRDVLNPKWQSAINQVDANPKPAIDVIGHKFYRYSDYTIHRTLNYYVSLKMISDRTVGWQEIKGVGKQGWHLSDGFTYVSFTGDEWAGTTRPTIDWSMLPGTTVEKKNRDPKEGSTAYGKRSFVGGISIGVAHGVSAMDFAAYNSCLTAKKSWFFFENQIIALGSNITCDSGNPVETVINQWPITNDPTTPFVVDGQQKPIFLGWSETLSDVRWFHHNTIGYVLPTAQTVKAKRMNQSGKWTDINAGNVNNSEYTNPFFTFWFDHGVRPQNQEYSYILLPNVSADQTREYAETSPITVIQNNAKVHAVSDAATGLLGIVFWEPGSVRGITVDKPAIVIVRDKTISISDPTQKLKTIRVTYKGKTKDVTLTEGRGEMTIESDIFTLRCTSFTNFSMNACAKGTLFNKKPRSPACISDRSVIMHFTQPNAIQMRYKQALDTKTYCDDPKEEKFTTPSAWSPYTKSSVYVFDVPGPKKFCVQYKNNEGESPWCGSVIEITQNPFGDINKNNTVDSDDIKQWKNVYRSSAVTLQNDLNHDKAIDLYDLMIIMKNFGKESGE